MFTNIGKKIKVLAKVLCWIGIIGGIISGISLIAVGASGAGFSASYYGSSSFVGGGALIAVGVVMLILLPLLAWVSSFVLYGFGEMVENTDEIKHSNEEILNQTYNIAQNVYFSARNNDAINNDKPNIPRQ